MIDDQLHWLWWAGGSIVTAIGLSIMLWACLAGRSRGRRRCPKCWYDLSATEGMRCSECGYEAPKEKRLFRTRRRWKVAFMGFAVLGLSPGALGWRAVQANWITHGPDTVLLASLWLMKDPSDVLKELDNRLSDRYHRDHTHCYRCFCSCGLSVESSMNRDDELWDWQWRLLARQLSKTAIDTQSPNRFDAYSIMEAIPDKRLVQDALVVGLTDADPSIVRSAVRVCDTIDQSEGLSNSFYAAAAEAIQKRRRCCHQPLIRLLSRHRRHAQTALPVLLDELIVSVHDHECDNRCARREHEGEYAMDAAVSLLLIADIATACDDRDLAIEVLQFVIDTRNSSRSIRHAAVQSLCILDPPSGVTLMHRIPRGDRRKVFHYLAAEYPNAAALVFELCMQQDDDQLRDDAIHGTYMRSVEFDAILPGLRRARAEDPELARLDSISLNVSLSPHEAVGEDMGGLLSILRQIRRLNAELPVRNSAGELVRPGKANDVRRPSSTHHPSG